MQLSGGENAGFVNSLQLHIFSPVSITFWTFSQFKEPSHFCSYASMQMSTPKSWFIFEHLIRLKCSSDMLVHLFSY